MYPKHQINVFFHKHSCHSVSMLNIDSVHVQLLIETDLQFTAQKIDINSLSAFLTLNPLFPYAVFLITVLGVCLPRPCLTFDL